jgi:hypothetical protein
MKTKSLILLSLTLAASVLIASAQTQTTGSQTSGQTWPTGPAWKLTPEQRAERQQKVQSTLTELRAKRDNGTINTNEKAWLDRMEQAGGRCVNGVPRGGGRGAGLGPRNGTGPRAQMGTCPLINDSSAAPTLSPGSRGGGFGRGWCGGRGAGQGGGFGLRNGTGPRAQMGMCPLLNDSTVAATPALGGRGRGFGMGSGRGRGRGWGGGFGLQNGTGPRAQDGTCPLLNPPAK